MFLNRWQAGITLGNKLLELITNENISRKNLLVIGMATGGVEVAFSVANTLKTKLQIIIIQRLILKKAQDSLSIGAVGLSKKGLFLHKKAIIELKTSQSELLDLISKNKQQIQSRYAVYPEKYWLKISPQDVVVLIDDGIATGEKILAASREIVAKKPHKIIIASPVVNQAILENIKQEFEAVIAIGFAQDFFSVSQWYQKFKKLTDKEVLKILTN